jgi:hypothetical protein
MAHSFESNFDHGQYDCSLEELTSRNKQIILLFSFGVFWLWLFIGVFDILWFWEEFYFAVSETGVISGGIWWSLLASLLTGMALGPLVFSVLIFSYRTKDVTEKWKGQIWGYLFLINPSIIWGLLWLVCLPYTLGILPWGEWSMNWWKIFPYGFGLVWLGGLPALIVIFNFLNLFINQKYNFNEQKEQEEDLTLNLDHEKASRQLQEALKNINESTESFWDNV